MTEGTFLESAFHSSMQDGFMYAPGPIPTPVLSPDEMLDPAAMEEGASREEWPEASGAGKENGAAGGAIGSTARGRRRPVYGEGGTEFKSGAILALCSEDEPT